MSFIMPSEAVRGSLPRKRSPLYPDISSYPITARSRSLLGGPDLPPFHFTHGIWRCFPMQTPLDSTARCKSWLRCLHSRQTKQVLEVTSGEDHSLNVTSAVWRSHVHVEVMRRSERHDEQRAPRLGSSCCRCPLRACFLGLE